jgi:hypothetical protein
MLKRINTNIFRIMAKKIKSLSMMIKTTKIIVTTMIMINEETLIERNKIVEILLGRYCTEPLAPISWNLPPLRLLAVRETSAEHSSAVLWFGYCTSVQLNSLRAAVGCPAPSQQDKRITDPPYKVQNEEKWMPHRQEMLFFFR